MIGQNISHYRVIEKLGGVIWVKFTKRRTRASTALSH
jgi:hypothetical protein